MGVPKSVKCPSSGVGKLVILSEPKRGLSAHLAINHEPGGQVTVLFLKTLKRTGTHAPFAIPRKGLNESTHDQAIAFRAADPERTVGQNPAVLWEQWSCIYTRTCNHSQSQGVPWTPLHPGGLHWACTTKVFRVCHTQK